MFHGVYEVSRCDTCDSCSAREGRSEEGTPTWLQSYIPCELCSVNFKWAEKLRMCPIILEPTTKKNVKYSKKRVH